MRRRQLAPLAVKMRRTFVLEFCARQQQRANFEAFLRSFRAASLENCTGATDDVDICGSIFAETPKCCALQASANS